MAFKNVLKEYMDLRHMIAADLARETGLSEAIISTYLSGKKEPSARSLNKISTALNVSMDVLLETEFAETEKNKLYADDSTEFLKEYFINKIGREPTKEELIRLDDFTDTFIKGLDK